MQHRVPPPLTMSATQGIAVSPSGSRSIHEPQPRPLAEARTVRYFGDENESVTFVHARLTRLRQTRGRLSSLTAPPVVLAMPPAVSRSGRVGFPSLSRPGAGLCEGDAVLGECLNGIRKLTTVRAVKFLSNVSRILHGGWRALSARAPVVVTGRLSAPFFLQKCLKDGHALVFWSRPPPFSGGEGDGQDFAGQGRGSGSGDILPAPGSDICCARWGQKPGALRTVFLVPKAQRA